MSRRARALPMLACLAATACAPPPPEPAAADVESLLGDGETAGYARASPAPDFTFPADHGAHPDFRSEWWYFTGNLEDDAGRAFGFQLTFFRFALAPQPRGGASAWGTRQAWMAHFAVSDVAGQQFHRSERLQRGALGLAGARAAPFRVWLGNWQAASTGQGLFPLRLVADAGEHSIDLRLDDARPLVLQGADGYSPKGPEAGNASLYYSHMRIAAGGRLRLDGTWREVRGEAWLDREWSTSALGPDLEGWEWFSLQLDDGSDLMLYRLRRDDGGASPFSAGTLVAADGRVSRLGVEDFELEPGRTWTSPETGSRYPVEWRLRIPAADLELTVVPLLDAQEMALSVRYWEGAVRARGTRGDRTMAGRGYLELAGY